MTRLPVILAAFLLPLPGMIRLAPGVVLTGMMLGGGGVL